MKRPEDFEKPTEGLRANGGAPLSEEALDAVAGGIQAGGASYCPLCRCEHTVTFVTTHQLKYGPYLLNAKKYTCSAKGDFYRARFRDQVKYFDTSLREL